MIASHQCCAYVFVAVMGCVQVTQKSFKFAKKHGCPFFFVSASDGTNVVRIFNEAILQGAVLAAN